MIRPFLNSLLRILRSFGCSDIDWLAASAFPRLPVFSGLLCGLLLTLSGCALNGDAAENPGRTRAVAGQLNFNESAERLFASAPVRIDGEWEVYWGQLYTAADFASPANQARLQSERRLISVPGAWQIPAEHRAVPAEDRERRFAQAIGFATLRLQVQGLPELARAAGELHLATRQWGLAYRLYCGSELVLANGIVGRQTDSSRPGRLPVTGALSPTCLQSGELIWQISNFHTAMSGPRLPLTLAPRLQMRADRFQRDLLAFLLSGVTLIITIYHLALYYFQRNDRIHWRFGFLAMTVLLWTSMQNDLPQRILGEDAHFAEVLRLQLLAVFIMPAAYYSYLQACFTREFPAKFLAPLVVLAIVFGVFNLLRPTLEITAMLPIYLGLLSLVVLYSVVATSIAVLRRVRGARLSFFSCLVVAMGIANDTFVYLGYYSGVNIVQYGWFAFIVSQSAMQAGTFSAAFQSADRTSRDLQIEVSKKMEELRETNDKLLELDSQRTAFFQNISHEFRTPLTLIKSPLEAAERREESVSRETQQVILSNARRLQRLVDQLLDLQRIAAGRMQMHPRPIALTQFVQLVSNAFEPYARVREIELSAEIEEGVPLVQVDPEMLDKCLYNYLSNALKFTAAGGRINICVRQEHGGARMEVRDTGMGIPRDQIPHLFTRFGYSRPSPVKDQAGSGLGLSLVKELIEMHSGRVGAESEEGRGSTFWFWLPPAPAGSVPTQVSREGLESELLEGSSGGGVRSADFEPAVPSITPRPPTRLGRGRAILLVEDNDDLRGYMRGVFETQGYRVAEAADGQQGLELLTSYRPDLIITDLMLPLVSGIDMIARIRKLPDHRTIPILLVTARADDQTKQEAHEAGADAYLPKPFDESELLAITRNLLSLKAREKELELDLAQARRIQENLLPQALPVVQGLRLASFYRPMDKVGGDLYDFIKMVDGSMGFFVGDVSGHGIPAALLASAVKMTLEAFGTRTYSPAELLKYMNESLYGRTADNFLSCSAGLILPDRKQVIYAQGGHPPAILIRDGKVHWHEAQGTWLGITPEVSFEEQAIDLEKGDRLILYTDGIVEAMNPGEEMFNEDRLADSALRHAKQPLKEHLELIVEEVFEFQGTGQVQDDITMIGIEVLS